MSRAKCWANNFAMGFFLLLTVVSAGMFWYVFVFQSAPVSNVQVQLVDQFTWAGGKFRVSYSAEQISDCPSFTVYILQDSTGRVYQTRAESPVPGNVFAVHVPDTVASGKAWFSQLTYYRCNPFREITVQTPKLEVEVVS